MTLTRPRPRERSLPFPAARLLCRNEREGKWNESSGNRVVSNGVLSKWCSGKWYEVISLCPPSPLFRAFEFPFKCSAVT